MNPFDFITFFNNYNIPYVTEGSNVAKGNINLKCPFCGVDDPSEHMGVNLKTGAWGCWRNADHRGFNPRRLIKQLLDCSNEDVNRIVGYSKSLVLNDFDNFINKFNIDPNVPNLEEIELPDNFKPISNINGINKRFYRYLINRGFYEKDIPEIVNQYKLKFAVTGDFSYRIIVPVYFNNKLVDWVARDITDTSKIRYKVREKTSSLSVKDIIYNYDELIKFPGNILFITEGPFDAIKVDYYGKHKGNRATCLFGTAFTNGQLVLLLELMNKYRNTMILFDEGAFEASLLLSKMIACPIARLSGAADPADLNPSRIISNKFYTY